MLYKSIALPIELRRRNVVYVQIPTLDRQGSIGSKEQAIVYAVVPYSSNRFCGKFDSEFDFLA